MIRTDAEFNQTREALLHLESALALLTRDKAQIHPERFVLMAEPIVADIRRLRREIEDYIGLTAVAVEEASS